MTLDNVIRKDPDISNQVNAICRQRQVSEFLQPVLGLIYNLHFLPQIPIGHVTQVLSPHSSSLYLFHFLHCLRTVTNGPNMLMLL